MDVAAVGYLPRLYVWEDPKLEDCLHVRLVRLLSSKELAASNRVGFGTLVNARLRGGTQRYQDCG